MNWHCMGKLAAPFSLSLRRWRDSRQRVTVALNQELQTLLTRAGKLLVVRSRGKPGREVLLGGLDKDAPAGDDYQEVALRALVGQRNVIRSVPPINTPSPCRCQ